VAGPTDLPFGGAARPVIDEPWAIKQGVVVPFGAMNFNEGTLLVTYLPQHDKAGAGGDAGELHTLLGFNGRIGAQVLYTQKVSGTIGSTSGAFRIGNDYPYRAWEEVRIALRWSRHLKELQIIVNGKPGGVGRFTGWVDAVAPEDGIHILSSSGAIRDLKVYGKALPAAKLALMTRG